LILDDVMVVAEPLLGGNRLRVAATDRREIRVGDIEPLRAFIKSREQRPTAPRIIRQSMREREPRSVRFELVLSE
jgi:hypothetical protein